MKNYLLGAIVTLAILFAGYTVGLLVKSNNVEAPYEPELCEVGRINPDGQLVYSQEYAGRTDFVVIMTTRGPKLFAECK